MNTAFLWLHLAGLVHLATLYGFTPKEHPSVLLPMLPLLVLGIPTRSWKLGRTVLVPLATLGVIAMGAFQLRAPAHAWNGPDWLPATALGSASLASTVVAHSREAEDRQPFVWIWCAGWFLAGALDPFLPLLGASLGALFAATGLWQKGADGLPEPEQKPEAGSAAKPRPFLVAFVMAALLGKPWWDFGMDRAWAFASAAFALGLALAAMDPCSQFLSKIRHRGFWISLGLFCLYPGPLPLVWSFVWALGAGMASGLLWHRRPAGMALGWIALAVTGGLAVSFALHANLWIPGLPYLLGWWR